MALLFGSNHSEVGSLSENLILNTAGKIKIRYGQKCIDLLDNKGNINSGNKVITAVNSENNMISDGFYLLNGVLYVRCNGKNTALFGNFVSYNEKQQITEDQINIVQKNIGLTFETDEEATKIITNGVVIVNGEIKAIKEGKISDYLNDILKEINDSTIENLEGNTRFKSLIKEDTQWKYVPVLKIIWQAYDLNTDKKIICNSDYTCYTYIPYGSSIGLVPYEFRKSDGYIYNNYEFGFDKEGNITKASELLPIIKDTVIKCTKDEETLKYILNGEDK